MCSQEMTFSTTDRFLRARILLCYLLRNVNQTLRQCNNMNVAHLTTGAFPVGLEIYSLQLERPEFLITLSQDMQSINFAIPWGLCCCSWSVRPINININGCSVHIRTTEKASVKVGHAAVMGCEAHFMYSISEGFILTNWSRKPSSWNQTAEMSCCWLQREQGWQRDCNYGG